MSELETFPDLAAVDAAQGRVNARGERVYTVDPRYRHHVEAERARIMAGLPVAPPTAPSSITGTTPLGQRMFVNGEPDPRLLELCQTLAARVGPDGKRLADSDPAYRANVEASFAEAMAGKRWGPQAQKLADELAREAASQAADSGLYRGAEKQPGVTFDRTDPLFQGAATVAHEQGLTEKQFGALLAWYAKGGSL